MKIDVTSIFFCLYYFNNKHPKMPKKSSSCAGKPKGYRYIKKANRCMSPCKKPQYRSRKSPYHCVTPKRSRVKCQPGFHRHRKSGTCRAVVRRLR